MDIVKAKACIFRLDGDASDRGFTESDLDRVVENFQSREPGTQTYVDAPWHLGHEEDRKVERAVLARTDAPSLGTTTKVWRSGTELWSEVEIPKVVLPLHQLYPTRSAEIYRDFGGRGATLKGVGTMGATQPAKKGLGEIVVLNDASGSEYLRGKAVTSAVQFQEGAMPEEGLAPMLLGRIQAVAAADEGKTTESVTAEVAQAAGMSSAEFIGLLTGQGDVALADEQLAAMANVLGTSMDQLKEALGQTTTDAAAAVEGEGDEAIEEEEVEEMAEPTNGAVAPTAEQFAEQNRRLTALETSLKEKNELLAAQKGHIAKLQDRADRAQTEKFAERIDGLIQREFLGTGRIGPGQVEGLKRLLGQHRGVVKFNEDGDAEFNDTVELLKGMLPARNESAVRYTEDRKPREGRITDIVSAFKEQQASGVSASFEAFAEAVGDLTPEEIAKGKALLGQDK